MTNVRTGVDESGIVYEVTLADPPKWISERWPKYLEAVEVRIDGLALIYAWQTYETGGRRWRSVNVAHERRVILGTFKLQESAISAAIQWRLRDDPNFKKLSLEERRKLMRPPAGEERRLLIRSLARELGGGTAVESFVADIIANRAAIEAFLIRFGEIDERIAEERAKRIRKVKPHTYRRPKG